VPARIRDHPVLTLLAGVSAILILVGRINREASWGDPVFFAGIAVLVIAAVLFLVARR